MKAQTLADVVRVFDPRSPLEGDRLTDYYVDRPGNPLARIKTYVQGLALADQSVKLLFTGHVGSGKSTALNKLAEELKRQFFIVAFDANRSLNIADLTYVDLLLGMATSLFRRATEADVLAKAPAQVVAGVWEDVARFVSSAIFGASLPQVPTPAEWSVKVNALAFEFQGKFASQASTRDEIRERVEPRLAELLDKMNFVADQVHINYKRPVLFFVEGTDKPDLKCARELFLEHTNSLTTFHASAIYTFPVGLRYSAEFNLIKESFNDHLMLPNVKVTNADESDNVEGLQLLSDVVSRRMESRLMNARARDTMVRVSGGLMRTLIRLVQRAAVHSLGEGSQTITQRNAEAAINEEQADFVAALETKDYAILQARHSDKRLSSDEDIQRLLQSRALLEYANGQPWCDVHPAALPLVEKWTKSKPATP
jgi:DNA polymerase III delta prime subunit